MAERKNIDPKKEEMNSNSKTDKNDKHFDRYFEKFFHLFLNYISKMYNDQSSYFKALLITDGTCIEHISNLNECLELNRFFLSCDILLTTSPESCVSNSFGFVFSEPLLATVAKILNGKIFNINDFEKIMEEPVVSVFNGSVEVNPFLKMILGISQRITYFYPFQKISSDDKSSKKTVQFYKKAKAKDPRSLYLIISQLHEHPPLKIVNYKDLFTNRLISFWRLCYVRRQNGVEKESTIIILCDL